MHLSAKFPANCTVNTALSQVFSTVSSRAACAQKYATHIVNAEIYTKDLSTAYFCFDPRCDELPKRMSRVTVRNLFVLSLLIQFSIAVQGVSVRCCSLQLEYNVPSQTIPNPFGRSEVSLYVTCPINLLNESRRGEYRLRLLLKTLALPVTAATDCLSGVTLQLPVDQRLCRDLPIIIRRRAGRLATCSVGVANPLRSMAEGRAAVAFVGNQLQFAVGAANFAIAAIEYGVGRE